jgi:hypothetical protein
VNAGRHSPRPSPTRRRAHSSGNESANSGEDDGGDGTERRQDHGERRTEQIETRWVSAIKQLNDAVVVIHSLRGWPAGGFDQGTERRMAGRKEFQTYHRLDLQRSPLVETPEDDHTSGHAIVTHITNGGASTSKRRIEQTRDPTSW